MTSPRQFIQRFLWISIVIQGNSDTGKKLAGDDLNKTVEFLATHAFEPSLPEERADAVAKYGEVVVVPRLIRQV